MKILIYSPVFFPMVGGMETVTECLAGMLVQEGHECEVVTPVEHHEVDAYPFNVHRNPGFIKKVALIRSADLVYSNGATLALLPLVKLLGKPFVWTHAGYQASCIDGLGWVNGEAAPMDPLGSIKYHWRQSGVWFTIKGAFKLFLRRQASKHVVDLNIAITDWVAKKQPFKRQIRIYNPSPLNKFRTPSSPASFEYDFMYLGRLVSEKGVGTLLKAFQILLKKTGENRRLLIIGDGDIREQLEETSRVLGINELVVFAGKKSGQELTDLVHQARIAVVPSEWEEPMGVVALELLAAERNLIVSEKGGLKECTGEAALVFPNGDAEALSQCMFRLLTDKNLAEKKKEMGRLKLREFEPQTLARQYIAAFNSIVKSK